MLRPLKEFSRTFVVVIMNACAYFEQEDSDGRRPGDWNCAKCGRHNYARNQVCFVDSCKWAKGKPFVIERASWYGRPGDEDLLFSSRNEEHARENDPEIKMFERRQTFDYSQQSSGGGGGGAQKAPEEDDSFKAKVVDYGHGGTSSDAAASIGKLQHHMNVDCMIMSWRFYLQLIPSRTHLVTELLTTETPNCLTHVRNSIGTKGISATILT